MYASAQGAGRMGKEGERRAKSGCDQRWDEQVEPWRDRGKAQWEGGKWWRRFYMYFVMCTFAVGSVQSGPGYSPSAGLRFTRMVTHFRTGSGKRGRDWAREEEEEEEERPVSADDRPFIPFRRLKW